MAAPVAAAETYIPCVGLQATLGGVAAAIMDGGFVPGMAVDDMTNDGGAGFYEDVPTIRKANGSHTLAYKGAGSPLGFVSGSVYLLVINAGSTPTFSGNVRVMLDAGNILDVKAGVKIKVTWTSQGAYTYSI